MASFQLFNEYLSDQNPYNNMKRELLLLHRSVALECPSYRGSKLSDQQVQDFVEVLYVCQTLIDHIVLSES